jgi:hypothetical protein
MLHAVTALVVRYQLWRVCVCVCVKREKEREREREREREGGGGGRERVPFACVYTCVCVCVCVCVNTYMHTNMHTYVCIYIQMCIHTYIHTHLSTCTDITGRQAPNPLPNKCETCKTYCKISRPPFHIWTKRSRVTGTLHGLMKTIEGAIESTIQNLCRGIPLEEC